MNEASDSKFVTKKWNVVNDQSNRNFDAGYEISWNVTVVAVHTTQVPVKNCSSFTTYITKSDGRTTKDNEELCLVTPMYNFLEKNSNYSDTAGSFWFYCKGINFDNDIANTEIFKSFQNQAKIL